MAISFGSATGNLFDRLGKLGLLLSQLRSYQGSQNTNLTNVTTGLVGQFNSESDIQALIGSAYIGQLNSPGQQIGSLCQNVARSTVNRMVYRDNPQIAQNLQSLNVLTSLREIIRQMKIQGATIRNHTITATPGSFTGTGNGIVNSSVRRPSDGIVLENSFAENLLLVCSSDSFLDNATEGNESFSVKGTGIQDSPFAFDWPLGSNANVSLSAIDGDVDNSSGNLLTNSSFNAFTSNDPDNWDIITGTAGVNVFQETSLTYDGASALRFLGDGSTLTQIRQQFGISTGTLGELNPLRQYSFNVYVRRDGVAAAAGVLTVDLTDGNGVVINDANGSANSFTIDLTTLTTSYNSRSGVFRTPHILPAAQRIRMRLTTALTNGRSVYFDKASLGEMTQIYRSGPFLAVHAGSIAFIVGDYATVVITNSRGSGGTLNTFQTLLARLFPGEVLGNELIFPSNAAPSISDVLIG